MIKLREAIRGVDTTVHHLVPVPACCPATNNPLAGSTLIVSYRPDGVVMPVEALSAMVNEYQGGHPDVREMEAMIQHIALRVVSVVKVRVRVRADLAIQPPYGGPTQRMVVSVVV